MRRARWKKKPLGPNLPVRASLGMRRLIANFPQSCHVLSECAATRLSTHAYAASCDVAFHSRVLVKAPCFSSRCRSRGWIPKEGAAAPSLWSFRKGVQGETQPKGFPLGLSLGATRFSRREKWVASAQPSSWLSPILRGYPLPLLKIPTRRCFRLAHLASWLHTVPVVNGVIPPPALDVMPPKMLARTAGFFHFLSPPNAIIH